jgi:predicted ATPase
MREGMAGYRATGAEMGYSYFLALLADSYRQAGETDAGLGAIDEAMAMVSRSGEHCYEAELHRIKGHLLLGALGARIGDATRAEDAEDCFHQAIAVARRQGARSFELRAASGLARLWQCQGKTADARQALSEVYGNLAEGFDTADMRVAKALLDALALCEG